jgi:hypothetical protein
MATSAASIGKDVSSMEFDLATLRSQVQAEGKLEPSQFITPIDYDTFLGSAKGKSEADRVAGIAKALEGSPRLEPAALNLAAHFYASKDSANCLRYADLVISSAPRILRRDPLRAHVRRTTSDEEDSGTFAHHAVDQDPTTGCRKDPHLEGSWTDAPHRVRVPARHRNRDTGAI